MNPIGKTIRALRQERGWNQQEVATQLNISIPAYSKIETGITDVNLSRLESIADLFGLKLTTLLSGGKDNPAYHQQMQLKDLNDRLQLRESEMIDLQNKMIRLFEELKKLPEKQSSGNSVKR
jgi:transcriptional regulator with XRE-family HTH domain